MIGFIFWWIVCWAFLPLFGVEGTTEIIGLNVSYWIIFGIVINIVLAILNTGRTRHVV